MDDRCKLQLKELLKRLSEGKLRQRRDDGEADADKGRSAAAGTNRPAAGGDGR